MQFMRRKTLALAIAALPFAAHANPQGGQIVAGSAEIRQETPTKVGITQTSDKAIIDWKSFSIGKNEHTQFYQPSANSVTLNRVVGEEPSQILGRLTANGRVFLVNPNGIFFGKDAQIDVAGLVASTHNIRNEDFLAGRYHFNIPGKPGAAVINEGTIRIADTGIAAFVAPSVANHGIIAARLGKVVLAAANGFTLDFYGDNLVSFLVADEIAQTAFDIEGKQLTSFVENSGRIEAQGGYVLLTARAAEGVVQSVINQSGSIEATTVGTHKGEIILNAGKSSLAVAGSLDASAPDGGDGGFIETSGGYVAIDPTTRVTTAAPFGSTGRWLIDPTDFVIAASGGNITGATLAGQLASSHIEIEAFSTGSGNGNGDLFVNDAVTWSANTKLTLTAFRDINVNANITATGNFAGLTLNPGTGGSGHFYMAPITSGKKITLSGSSPSLSIAGQNYTVINTLAALQSINSEFTPYVFSYYALGSDIAAAGTETWNGGQGFVPIGTFGSPFTGIFDGLGHSINKLWINRPTEDYVGLFGLTSSASIANVRLSDGSITGGNSVGGVAGAALFGWITNVATGAGVIGNSVVGGLVGQHDYGNIVDSYSTGTVVGTASPLTYVGGLVGVNKSQISRSFSSGEVRGDQSVGGLVGYSPGAGKISDSYASGDVYGKSGVGGLLGTNYAGIIERTMAYGTVHNLGTFTDRIGGLIGRNTVDVVDSYWDISKFSTSQGGTGLSTSAMTRQSSFTGWNFAGAWRIDEGSSYPYLAWSSPTTVSGSTVSGSTGVSPSSNTEANRATTDICKLAPQVCVTQYERGGSRSDPDVLMGSDPIGAEIRQLLNDYSDRTDGSAVSRMTQTEFLYITDRLRSAGVSLVDKEIDQYLDRNLSAVDSLWGHRLDEAKENMYREAEASWSDRGKVAFAAAIAPAMTVADLTGIGIAAKYLKVAFKATKGKDMLNTFGKIYDNLANNRRGWNNSNVLNSFEKLKKVADSNAGKRLLEIMKLELDLADGNAPDENDVLKAELRRTLETLGLPSAGSATDAVRELIVQATAGAMEVVQADSKDVSLEAKRVALEALSSATELIPVAGNWVALHNTYGEVEREFKDSQQTYVELNVRYINAREQVYRDALSMKLQYLAGQVRP